VNITCFGGISEWHRFCDIFSFSSKVGNTHDGLSGVLVRANFGRPTRK